MDTLLSLNSECELHFPIHAWVSFSVQMLKLRFLNLLLKPWPLFLLFLQIFRWTWLLYLLLSTSDETISTLSSKTYNFPESTVKISQQAKRVGSEVVWGCGIWQGMLSPPGFIMWIQTRITLVYWNNSCSRKINLFAWQRIIRYTQ